MIIRRVHHAHYTLIGNQALRDQKLSWKATGLLCYLLGLPDNWRISSRELAKAKADGRTSVLTVLRELEQAGYVRRRVEHRYDGKNCTLAGTDCGRAVPICDVTDLQFQFESPPQDLLVDEKTYDEDEAEDLLPNSLAESYQSGNQTSSPDAPKAIGRETCPTAPLSDSSPDHKEVLSLRSTVLDEVPPSGGASSNGSVLVSDPPQPDPQNLTTTGEEFHSRADLPPSPAQRALLAQLLQERDAPNTLRQALQRARTKHELSPLLEQLRSCPRAAPVSTTVAVKFWAGSASWTDRLPISTVEWLERCLAHHQKQNLFNRPAVFELNGQDVMISALKRLTPQRTRWPHTEDVEDGDGG